VPFLRSGLAEVIAIVAGGVTLVLDQLAKEVALRRPHWRPALNTRVPFGTRRRFLLFLALWSLLAAGLVVAADRPPLAGEWVAVAGVGAALGGAAGNLVDWFRRGGVIDFIAIYRWPAFNLADTAIVGGVLLALGALL
jgi:lipoprotein signal peptidase